MMPCFVQGFLHFYMISLATAVTRMIFEIPIRLLDDRVEIVPLAVICHALFCSAIRRFAASIVHKRRLLFTYGLL